MAVLDAGQSARDAGPATPARALHRFWRWYRDQAALLLPARITRWLNDTGAPGIVVSAPTDQAPSTVTILRGARVLSRHVLASDPATDAAPLSAGAMADKIKTSGGEVALNIRRDMCLIRSFDIPREAVPRLDSVLAAGIARRTPFAPADVYHGASLSPHPADPAKLAVRHAIVRRDLADAEAQRAGLAISGIGVLMVEAADGSPPLAVRVVPQPQPAKWPGRLACALLVCGALALAAGAYSTLDDLTTRLARLDTAITSASAKAQAVRRLVDGAGAESALLAGLRTAKSERAQLMDVVEELSRVLPDGTWISELRLSEDRPGEAVLSITGYSDRATALVALLDRSQMFTATALASAITPDPAEGRDRFQLQTRLVKSQPAARPKP